MPFFLVSKIPRSSSLLFLHTSTPDAVPAPPLPWPHTTHTHHLYPQQANKHSTTRCGEGPSQPSQVLCTLLPNMGGGALAKFKPRVALAAWSIAAEGEGGWEGDLFSARPCGHGGVVVRDKTGEAPVRDSRSYGVL